MRAPRSAHAARTRRRGDRMIDRRAFIRLFGGTVIAWPLAARAQQSAQVHRIGFLRVGAPPPSFITPLQTMLKELGYVVVVAPDGGAHVCAPRQVGRNQGVLF